MLYLLAISHHLRNTKPEEPISLSGIRDDLHATCFEAKDQVRTTIMKSSWICNRIHSSQNCSTQSRSPCNDICLNVQLSDVIPEQQKMQD